MGLSSLLPGGSEGSRGAREAWRCSLLKVKPSIQGAPRSIHFLRESMSLLDSLAPFGGILFFLSALRTRWMMALRELLPSSRAGPFSPPASRLARVFIDRPPLRFSSIWHLPQLFLSSGATLSWKREPGPSSAAAERAQNASATVSRRISGLFMNYFPCLNIA